MTINPYYGILGYGVGGYGNQPIEDLPIGYYINLVIHEYRNSPKFMALLRVLLKKFDDVSNCMVKMDTALDLDWAKGANLDLLGSIWHAPRTVPFQPSNSVSPVLDDTTYRILIKATIAKCMWNGKIDSLYFIWQQLFP